MDRAVTVKDIILKATGPLSKAQEAAIVASLNPKTGQLRATRPTEPMACGAWLGLQPNPWKVSIPAFLLLPAEAKELCNLLAKFPWPAELDRDAGELKSLGVW